VWLQRKEDKRNIEDNMDSNNECYMPNQIMPKNPLETSDTISKLKYFGHTMHSPECMRNVLMLGLTDGSGR